MPAQRPPLPHSVRRHSPTRVTIKTGLIPADIAAPAEYARANGYFKNAGLDVDVQVMQSGPSIAPAVLGGSLTVGAMNSGSLAAARERGLPLLYFAPVALLPPSTMVNVMMVRNDSPIRTGTDANGKTVGIVGVKTLEHAAMLLWVDKHGGDSRTLKFAEMPYPEMGPALAAGRVDIVLASEPFATQFRGPNRFLSGVFAAMPGPFLTYGYFAAESWLNANAEVALRYAAAIKQAAEWANGHQKDSGTLLAAWTKMDPKVVNSMARTTYATTLDPANIQPAIDVMVKYGFLPKPIDATTLVWRPGKA